MFVALLGSFQNNKPVVFCTKHNLSKVAVKYRYIMVTFQRPHFDLSALRVTQYTLRIGDDPSNVQQGKAVRRSYCRLAVTV